ncbi:PLP-dependent aminotransferase family protein [Xenorhabdus bovienii]|uniref:Putative bifunctional: transcriptional regulator (GntR family) (N-terminal) amino transferase (C-terminal) n=2 Tax=Xenorhabdus bovienii TaxID=40576 RepID=A0A077NAX4_XENBV|nr:PLP-dependent aminotransferase family protein [Xenorhabdus bovienii]MCG3462536.1 PLP-dependent aminotransferase family protein [Xenorhabdus bovienii]MCG3472108.1 PLP-dependent aminotransferase family protein [Xenorhabdus bovienii]CDG89461.1 putative bifunctional: transcriptional regulator (GntR family) (N-terminal); amino transferase (C-terminal) [Xenorhabdus bovienii str. feltiae France]CDG93645.1 putative bifunctional: transcriptional regulator (GntR family) (N-terminal); amino transferase
MTRYEQLAGAIRQQIEDDIWQVGDKLPSLRESVKSSGLSLMTVLQAYQLLESQGWIVARPQSGYYVATRLTQFAAAKGGKGLHLSESVEISASIFDVLQACKDPKIVPFGSAFPDPSLLNEPKLSKILASVARRFVPHSSLENLPPGNEKLRRNISRRYAAHGIHVSPDEIVITAGAMESLSFSLQSVTSPGDWVVIESPAFYGALQAIERLRLKAIAIKTDPRTGIDLDALEEIVQKYPIKACWLMSRFQNPLCNTMPSENKQRLVEILNSSHIALIEDDVYGELYFDQEPPMPIKAWDKENNFMHCSSFSKCLAPGYRVGWVAAGKHAGKIQQLQMMSTVSASAPTQLAVAEYLAHGGYDNHLRRLRRQLEQRQSQVLRAISEYFPDSVKVNSARGGYFLWLEFEPPFNANRLYRLALAKGISIAPGSMFSTSSQFDHAFRLNTSFAWNDVQASAMKTLADLCHTLLRECG